ncbi:MAG: hypothetical protein E3K32_12670 [wastewater metagenome]|nr:hypothetical protein [Candidatus Loosdrechtia aerotolerans]
MLNKAKCHSLSIIYGFFPVDLIFGAWKVAIGSEKLNYTTMFTINDRDGKLNNTEDGFTMIVGNTVVF